MDGKPLLEKLDGKSLPVDIGSHTFRFELSGSSVAPAERHAVIHEGDKNRKIAVVFRPTGSDRPIAPSPTLSELSPSPRSLAGPSLASEVL
jgi:hypothetical protein